MAQLTLFDMPTPKERVERKEWRWAIPDLLGKSDGKCCVCDEQIIAMDGAHAWIEHIVPIALGGADELDNLGVSHPYCNLVKRDRMPDDPVLEAWLPKLKTMAKQPPKERDCIDCGASIAHKGYTAFLCDDCTKERKRDSRLSAYAENPEKFRAYARDFARNKRMKNPEEARARDRQKYAANPEPRKAQTRKYRNANPEKVKAGNKAWYAANKDEYNAMRREKNALNRKERFCLDCGMNINHRGSGAVRCETCRDNHEIKWRREYYLNHRKDRLCLDCNANINHRGAGSKRCESCQEIRSLAIRKSKLKDRRCLDCGIDINHRGGTAKRCAPCQKQYKREHHTEYMRARRARKRADTLTHEEV